MASRWGLGSMLRCLGTAEGCSDSRLAEDPVGLMLKASHTSLVGSRE